MTELQLKKFKAAFKAAATAIGMEQEGTTGNAFERYYCGFATVSISFDHHDEQFIVERYYDSELVNHGRQVTETYPLTNMNVAIARCAALIRTVRNDEPIFGGIE